MGDVGTLPEQLRLLADAPDSDLQRRASGTVMMQAAGLIESLAADREAAVAAARAEIVGWLEAEAEKERRIAEHCREQLDAYNASKCESRASETARLAAAIRSGAPQRWTAERAADAGKLIRTLR